MDTVVSSSSSPLITIAEIGLNHDGCITKAQHLIQHAARSGFSAVKFQLRSPNTFLAKYSSSERDLGSEIVDEYICRTYLDYNQYAELYHYALSLGIDCFFSSWDIESVQFVHNLNPRPRYFKVASADLTNFFLIDSILEKRYHIILSTGMSTHDDIVSACSHLSSRSAEFSLLHCHSAYPSPLHHLNLDYIKVLGRLPGPKSVGYSSHDKGFLPSALAVFLGADIIEKHIALDRHTYGNDKSVSLLPEELQGFLSACNDAFVMRNNQAQSDSRVVFPGEKSNKISLSKSLRAKRDIPAHKPLCLDDFDFYPSGEGLSLQAAYLSIGKPLLADCLQSELLLQKHLAEKSSTYSDSVTYSDLCGIPVRYRDASLLLERLSVPYIEYHLTFGDISCPVSTLTKPKGVDLNQVAIGFHTPDIYKGSHIFDPFSRDIEHARYSKQCLHDVCQHVQLAASKISPFQQRVKLVCSFSSYSECTYLPDRASDYTRLAELLDEFSVIYPSIDLLPQSLPARAWYLGGQRYVNVFADPRQILQFCKSYNRKICFDLSHHIMSCNYYSLNIFESYAPLKPFISHVHLANASGIDDEGTSFDHLDDNVLLLLNDLLPHISSSPDVTSIVETWQGHLQNGLGFKTDISLINSIFYSS